MKFQTVKERILAAFFVYSGISFAVSTTSFILFRDMESVDAATSAVNRLYNQTLNGLRIGQEFFAYEIYSESFHITGISSTLTKHDKTFEEVSLQIIDITEQKGTKDLDMVNDLLRLSASVQSYRNLHRQIVEKLKEKGFKDYGVLGNMRREIQDIEQEMKEDALLITSLRRKEEEYLLQRDTAYYGRVAELSNQLSDRITVSRNLSDYKRRSLTNKLQNYNEYFRRVIRLDFELGFHNAETNLGGLAPRLQKNILDINQLVEQINAKAIDRKFDLNTRIQVILVCIVTLSVIITLFLSLSFKFVLEEDPDKIQSL